MVKLSNEDKVLVYPAKNRNFVSSYKPPYGNDFDSVKEETEKNENLYNAVYDAVMGLANNRYQENIDLNAQEYKSVLDLTSADFSWGVRVYMDDGFYKLLPVGEIETDSKGKHIVRLGYRIQELTQEL